MQHMQAQAEENLAKQREVLDVIGKSQAAYKHVFGFAEWRSACEVRSPPPAAFAMRPCPARLAAGWSTQATTLLANGHCALLASPGCLHAIRSLLVIKCPRLVVRMNPCTGSTKTSPWVSACHLLLPLACGVCPF